MLTAKIQQITAETAAIKKEIYDAIVAQAPPEDTRSPYKILKSSKPERGIVNSAYYNTGKQLRRLSDFVADGDNSLEMIFNVLCSVVKYGRAQALPGVMFNDVARTTIQSIL